MSLIYLVIPIICVILIIKNFYSIGKPEMRDRFGAFYEGLKVEKGRKILIDPVFYLLRRIGMAWLILQDTITPLMIQLMVVFAMSFVTMITSNILEAHEDKSRVRFMNLTEMVFLSTAYMFIIFNMVSVEDNFTIGYVPIVTFGVYIFYVLTSVFIGII